MCQQIWLGHYVDLAMLLNKDQLQQGSNLFINEKGTIEVRPKTQKKISAIREWTDAFITFTAIYLKKHPGLAGDLLQYMSIILRLKVGQGGHLHGGHTMRILD